MKIHDISVPLSHTTPVYPGDAPVRLERLHKMEEGAVYNFSRLESSVHSGTHVDAPLHFVSGAPSIDRVDLERLVGPAQVADLTRVARLITAQDLEAAQIEPDTRRLLLKTRNSQLWQRPGFQQDFVGLAPDAAEWLIRRQIGLVGIDYLSIEPFDSADLTVHKLLLGAGILIVENLNLGEVRPGAYQLICLPLKIEGGEGAPARAMLMQA